MPTEDHPGIHKWAANEEVGDRPLLSIANLILYKDLATNAARSAVRQA